MAATDVDPLPQLLNEIASRFGKQQEAQVVEMFSTTLDKRYRISSTAREVFDLLHRDNRITLSDLFLLEKCIGEIEVGNLIKEFKKKHEKEISSFKEQETLLVRRQGVYERVDSVMRNSHGLLLYGEAGVGKTFLAKDYLNLNQKDSFKEVDLRDVKDSNILIVKILQKFGFIKSIEEVDLDVLKTCLKKSAIKKRVILFLDNTDDLVDQENRMKVTETADDKDIAFSDVVETVVKAGGGLIKLLITSRNPSETTKFNYILMSQKVDQLQKSLALELISRVNMPCQPSKEMLNEAVEICKCLPLNLNLVGGMLQNAGTVIEDVNHIIETYAERKLKKISDEKVAKKKEVEISTLSILKANFDKLGDTVQQGAVALSLFCRSFTINDVEFMFEDMMETDRLNLILHALKHLKVLQLQDDKKYDFHPMVRSFLESKSKIDHINPFYQQAKMKFIFKFKTHFKKIAELLQDNYDHGREMFQHDFGNFKLTLDIHTADGIPFFEDYYDLQHASGLLKAMFKSEWRTDFFQQVAESYIKPGEDLKVSLYLCEAAQSCAKRNPHRALDLLSQVKQHIELARKAESADVGERQLMAVESLYSEATGNAWHSIGKNSWKISDVMEALDGFKEAYTLRTKLYEKNSKKADLARSLAGLGACQALHATILNDTKEKGSEKLIKKKLKVALDCFGESLKMYEKCCRYSSEIPIILQNIGHAHLESGSYKKAYKYCIKALQKEKDLKIDGSQSTALIMFNIACSCRELNKNAEAIRFSKEGYMILKELLKTHPDTVKSLYQVAVIHHEQGMLIDALEYYKKAFWMEEDLPDNFHSPERMDIRRNMIVAFERAIKKGFTSLNDDMKEWKTLFSELEKNEEEKKKMQVTCQQPQRAADSQKPGPAKAEVSKVTESAQQLALEEISVSLTSSSEDEEAEDEWNLGEFIDPGMVRVFMDADGGKCEFKYLGVTLDVPQDSIDNIELQISCVSPSDVSIRRNPLRLAFGDYVISDIIKIGPDGQSFRRPASLSIPYSIFEVPLGRHIAMKCLNEEENSWDSIQVELRKDASTGNRIAVAEILKTSMYVVCILHNVATYVVPKSGIEISPFDEDYGVKIIFDEDTFESDNVKIDVKLSLFTNDATKRLQLLGLKATPVLHVDVANSEYLLKPVTIKFAIEEIVQKRGKMVILRDNYNTFEDITDDATEVAKSENSISMKVDHFSSLSVSWSSYLFEKTSKIIEYLTDCLFPPVSVWFQVYGRHPKRDWVVCVACSQEHHMRQVEERLSKTLEFIEQSYYNEGMFTGTKMNVDICGSYYIPEGIVSLLFKSAAPCYTKQFRVENAEGKDECSDVVIRGENDDEYTRFPLSSLTDDCKRSGSMIDESSDSDSENGITGDPEPYRFFGLKLEKCDFEGVCLGIEKVLQLEKHKILPDQYIENIKSEVRRDVRISALKLTLRRLTEYYSGDRQLKKGWLEMIFKKPGSLDCYSRLRKVLDFLEKPCNDRIHTPGDISSFLELIHTRDRVFKHQKVRKCFLKELGLKCGDRENIEREQKKDGNLCKLMLEHSFFVEDSKISCLFDVVKALLRTKARIERNSSRQARRIQKLLDDLGKHLEEILFKNHGNDDVGGGSDDSDW